MIRFTRRAIAIWFAVALVSVPLALTVGLGPAGSAEPDSWETLPAEKELPREIDEGAATIGKDGRIYVLGGGTDRTAAAAFDPASGTWDLTMPRMKTGRYNFAATTDHDGKIYAIGGEGTTSVPEMEVYDPANPAKGWVTVLEATIFRTGHAAVTGPDGLIYVMGGSGYGVVAGNQVATSVDVFNPKDPGKGWVPAPSMGVARNNLAAAVGGDGLIYAIGGGYPATASVEAYDHVSKTWSPAASMVTPRLDLAAATGPDGRIYAIGGTRGSFLGSLKTVEIFDPQRPGSWEAGAPMKTAREALMAAASGGRIFALGGESISVDLTVGPKLKSIEAYTPPLRGPPQAKTPPRVSGAFEEWDTRSAPRGISADAAGNVWFTADEMIGRMSPEGNFRYFSIPPVQGPFGAATGTLSSPFGIVEGQDGAMWFTEQTANSIGRMTAKGEFTRYPILTSPPAGTQRIGPRHITKGPDGALWFTLFSAGKIGRITMSGAVTEYPIPNADSKPDDITLGSDGNLWFLQTFSSFAWKDVRRDPKIGRITPAGVVSEFDSQLLGGGFTSITSGPDGNLWYTQGDFIGRMNPRAANPTETSRMYGFEYRFAPREITAGPDGNLWFTIYRAHYISPYKQEYSEQRKIAKISPAKPAWVTEFELPKTTKKDGTVLKSTPGPMMSGPGPLLWFGATGPPVVTRFDPSKAGTGAPYLPHGAEVDCVNLKQRAPLRPRNTHSDSCHISTDEGPLDHIIVSPTLNCQVYHVIDDQPEHYQQPVPSARDGECGTFLAVPKPDRPDQMQVWGPRTVPCYYYNGLADNQCVSAKPATSFRMLGQRGVFGSGTIKDPYWIETEVRAGDLVLRQVDKYIVGSETYRTDVTVTNPTDKAAEARLTRGGDCYLQSSDRGYQRYKPESGGIACRPSLVGTPTGPRIQEWTPLSPGSRWFGGSRHDLWKQVGDGSAFPNGCLGDCRAETENGAGLTWDLRLAPGESVTHSHLTTFSPFGYEYLKNISDTELGEPPPGDREIAELEITMDQTAEDDQEVFFSTFDGTAVGGQDYEPTQGSVIIPAGQKSQTVEIPVLGDGVPEEDETFSVEISTRPAFELGGNPTNLPPAKAPQNPANPFQGFSYTPYFAYMDEATYGHELHKPQSTVGTVTIHNEGDRPGAFEHPPAASISTPGPAGTTADPPTPEEAQGAFAPSPNGSLLAALPLPPIPGNALNPLNQTQSQSQNQSQQQQQQQQQQQMQQQAQTQTMAALMNEQERQREVAREPTGPNDRNPEFNASALAKNDRTQLVVRLAGAMAFLAGLGLVRNAGRQPNKLWASGRAGGGNRTKHR